MNLKFYRRVVQVVQKIIPQVMLFVIFMSIFFFQNIEIRKTEMWNLSQHFRDHFHHPNKKVIKTVFHDIVII